MDGKCSNYWNAKRCQSRHSSLQGYEFINPLRSICSCLIVDIAHGFVSCLESVLFWEGCCWPWLGLVSIPIIITNTDSADRKGRDAFVNCWYCLNGGQVIGARQHINEVCLSQKVGVNAIGTCVECHTIATTILTPVTQAAPTADPSIARCSC